MSIHFLMRYSYIPYRTKVWREKSLANLAKLDRSPNFCRQTFGFQKQVSQLARDSRKPDVI